MLRLAFTVAALADQLLCLGLNGLHLCLNIFVQPVRPIPLPWQMLFGQIVPTMLAMVACVPARAICKWLKLRQASYRACALHVSHFVAAILPFQQPTLAAIARHMRQHPSMCMLCQANCCYSMPRSPRSSGTVTSVTATCLNGAWGQYGSCGTVAGEAEMA
jgi:hypothetical protein